MGNPTAVNRGESYDLNFGELSRNIGVNWWAHNYQTEKKNIAWHGKHVRIIQGFLFRDKLSLVYPIYQLYMYT